MQKLILCYISVGNNLFTMILILIVNFVLFILGSLLADGRLYFADQKWEQHLYIGSSLN